MNIENIIILRVFKDRERKMVEIVEMSGTGGVGIRVV